VAKVAIRQLAVVYYGDWKVFVMVAHWRLKIGTQGIPDSISHLSQEAKYHFVLYKSESHKNTFRSNTNHSSANHFSLIHHHHQQKYS